MNRPQIIYFLRDPDNGWIKIGFTSNIEQRMKQHKTTNPRLVIERQFETEFASKIESYIKNRLLDRRFSGEHYNVSIDEIDKIIKEIELIEKEFIKEEDINKIRDMIELEPERQPTNIENSLCEELKRIRIQLEDLKIHEEIIKNKLIKSIGSSMGLVGKIDFKSYEATKFETEKFKQDQPELYEKYLIKKTSRRFYLK